MSRVGAAVGAVTGGLLGLISHEAIKRPLNVDAATWETVQEVERQGLNLALSGLGGAVVGAAIGAGGSLAKQLDAGVGERLKAMGGDVFP